MMNRMMNMMANDMVAAIAAENMELFNRLGMTRAFKKNFEMYLDLTGIDVKDGDEWRGTAVYATEDGNIVVEYDRNGNIVNVYKDDEELIDDSFFTLKPGRSAGRKKNRQDALHRIKDAGGKKRGRTRKDYVEHRKDNHDGKLYQQSIYMGATVKNRRYAEKMADLERGVLDDELVKQETDRLGLLLDARKEQNRKADKLQDEVDFLKRLEDDLIEAMRERIKESGVTLKYEPSLRIDSRVWDALYDVLDTVERIDEEIEESR